MGFLDLFSVATMPVLEVLLITALGSFLALDSVDILGDNARKHMNTLVFFVFSPAVVGGYLAKTITFESLILLWFMPLNILFTFIIGTVLGWILLKIAKAPQHLKGLVISSCSAANLGNLPLILIPAICRQKGSPFGAPDICHTYGMTYSSLGMAIGAVYLWSYVYNIVRVSSSSTRQEEICSNVSTVSKKMHSDISEALEGNYVEPLLPPEDQPTLPQRKFDDEEEVLFSVKIKQQFEKFQRKINLKALLAPSTIGAIIGFTVGVVPLLRKTMIGGAAPLHVIEDAAILLGDSAIPAQTLIVGANLIKGLKGSGIKPSLVIGIIIIRYLFLPLFGIVIVKGAIHFGMVQSDPLYQFVLLLQYALPPALNIGTITQLFGAGESECSVIMLWTYAFASVSLTLWSTYFMCTSRKMEVLSLFMVAIMPVLEVLLISALGSFLALDSVGILGDTARKNLNTLVVFLFCPALVGSYLAKTVTFESLELLWFMPLNILFTYIIGSALGWILLKITKPPQHLRGLLISSCSAANLGTLPPIMIPAICRQKGSPFGAPDICHTYGMTYASLGMAVGAVYLWSYVYNIVRVSSSSINEAVISSNQSIDTMEFGDISEVLEGSYTEPLLQHTYHHEENASFAVLFQKSFKGFQKKIHLKALLAPSTVGAIVGFTIGVIPQVRKLIIGGAAPLHVIEDAAILLGDSTTPALTLILGANLLKGLTGSGVKPSLIVGIILIRFVFLPLVGIAIVKGAIGFGMVHADPLYQFVLLLQYALPPALNIGTITQLFGAGQSECSVIMLWTYAFASVSLTLWSTYFMWLVV